MSHSLLSNRSQTVLPGILDECVIVTCWRRSIEMVKLRLLCSGASRDAWASTGSRYDTRKDKTGMVAAEEMEESVYREIRASRPSFDGVRKRDMLA